MLGELEAKDLPEADLIIAQEQIWEAEKQIRLSVESRIESEHRRKDE